MMTTPDPQPSDDVLARAAGALRRMPVTEGPSEVVLSRILAALHAASGPRPPVPPRRRIAPWAMQSAAAAVVVASLCYIVAAWLSRPVLAFAEVAQKLRDARTLTYRTTLQIAGLPEPIAVRVLVKAPALIRCEVESDGSVTVIDGTGNRILVLDPKSRSALLLDGPVAADGARRTWPPRRSRGSASWPRPRASPSVAAGSAMWRPRASASGNRDRKSSSGSTRGRRSRSGST